MSEAGLILAINLTLGLTLFGVFVGLHFYRPADRRNLWYACAFAAAIASGLLEMALPYVDSALVVRYAIFATFLVALLLLLEGLQRQYQTAIDRRVVLGSFVAGLLVNVVTLFLARNSLLRMALYQLPYVAMATLCTLAVIRSRRGRWADRMLAVFLVLFALHFASRPLAALVSGGMGATASDYLSTIYAVTTQFDVAILTIAIAVTLLGLAVADIVADLENGMRHDPLTGIFNRLGFDSAFRGRLPDDRSAVCCLIACDLDDFKSINDTYGHAAGDAALVLVADALREGRRSSDTVARVGGEEFALILPDTAAADARALADRVNAALADTAPKLTVSAGVADTSATPLSPLDLLRLADEALYRAKHAGRARAEISVASRHVL